MQHRIGRVNIGPEQYGLLRILALIMLCFLPGGAVKAAILESDFATHLVVPDKGDERSKAPKIKDLKADDSDAFITVWEVPADDLNIHIPIFSNWMYNYKYDITVEKEGSSNIIKSLSGQTSDLNIPVTEAGRYIVKIRGDFPHFRLVNNNQKDKDKLVAVKQWGTIKWKSFNYAFHNARKLQSVPTTAAPDLSSVTDMSFMFSGASAFNQDLSSWNVSKVTNMTNMFIGAKAFNQDLSSWDVSQVTNMSFMFSGASAFNQDLSSWDVSQVTDMSFMFSGASDFNQDLSSWDVSQVTDMFFMFSGASAFNQDLSSWDVSQVTDMSFMFNASSAFNQDLASWDVAKVGSMINMLSNSGLSSLNYDKTLIGWAANPNGLVQGVYLGAHGLKWCSSAVARDFLKNQKNLNITGDTEDCTQANDSDAFITVWDVPLGDLNIHIPVSPDLTYNYSISWEMEGDPNSIQYSSDQKIDFYRTVNKAGRYIVKIRGDFPRFYLGTGSKRNVDKLVAVQQWGTIKWKSFVSAFLLAINLQSIPTAAPDLSAVTNMRNMFSFATVFNGDLSSWDVSNVTDMSEMFYGASAFNGNLSSWDVSNVTDMSKMFSGASAFNWNLSYWDVSKVTDMSDMFYGASAFNQNLADWDVSLVGNMSRMLSGSGLSSLNYDKTLIGWANNKNGLKPNVSLGADGLKWCNADVVRGVLINQNGWRITGDTKDCTQADDSDAFITVWEVPANDLSIYIPISSTSTYNYSISVEKEGSSNIKESSSGQTGDFSTLVPEAGRYIVKIRGDFPHFNFKNTDQINRDKLVAVQQWGAIKWKSFAYSFHNAINLKSFPTAEAPDLSSVTDMSYMFYGAFAFNGDLSSWDVSKVTDMTTMFSFASAFNGNLASWDFSQVTNMSYMFVRASAFNQNLADWNVSQVTNMTGMLSYSGLSMLNYDKTLIGWAANPNGLKPNIELDAYGLKYCSSAATRAILINQKGWRISGDEQKCIQADANNILYVSKSATGDRTGSSWKNALPELADALSWARNQTDAGLGWEATNPLKIYVAVGRYTPLYNAADGKYTEDGQRDNSFVLVKNVQLFGGFDPKNGYDFQQRVQPKASHLLATPQGTILTADLAKNDKVVELNGALDFKNYTDNAYHVLIASGAVDKALVDGFVIQGGSAEGFGAIVVNGHNVSIGAGAGLNITKANLQIRNLDIAYNKGNFGGGGLFEYSDANLFNISLNHNHAAYEGGGFYHYESNPTLSNLTITNNTSRLEGAGLRNVDNSSPLILNSILYGNTAGNSLTNNVANHNNSSATFQHSLLAGDGSWNSAWGKDGEANDGENIITNLDPFVDRAQADFRLKRASSAVDAGSMIRLWAALQKAGPMPAVTDARWGMDLVGSARILGGQVDMGAYEFSCPTVTPTADAQQSFCVDNAITIASLIADGEQIKWYSAAYGGILYLSTEVLVDGQTYYASQTKDGCESQSRVAVQVALIQLPDAPVVNAEQQLSYGDTPLALSATASVDCELRWYSAETGGTASMQAPIPVTNVIGKQFFWVSQVNTTTGCESPRSKITVSISKAMPNLGALASIQKTYGDAPFILSPPSSNSPGAFSYSSAATELATVKDTELTIIGAGTTRITVRQAATDYYSEATTSFDLIVDKATIRAISFADTSHTYDGTAKSVVLVGSLPQGATVSYSNNGHTEAGTYTATATILGGANYSDQSLTAVLSIDKATIRAISFADASYTYDGTAKSIVLIGSLPQGASVSYSNNSHTDAGTYTATATILGGANYSDHSLTAVLSIAKAVIPAISFADASHTYDGTAKSVVLVGSLPQGATVSYSNNSQTDAGTYTATANISGGANYSDQSLTAVLSIAKKQQVIRFGGIAAVKADAGLISLDISSNSSLPIQLYSENTAVATVVGNGLRVIGAGRTVIRAEQAGDANHLAAVAVSQTLDVSELKEAVVDIRVHQAVSPNGDGINDFLRIDGIDNYPENKLVVFDSNGTVIQTIVGYNNHSNYFDGTKGSKPLSKGTYFYTLTVKVDGKSQYDKGFFVIRY